MAKYAHPDVLDGGLNAIRNAANQWHVLRNYTVADSYGTVQGNSLGNVTMVPSDYVLANGSGNARTLTTPSNKTATATAASGASPNLHFAFIDTATSRVLWVTDETTDQVIASGNPMSLPALTYTSLQPV